MRVALVIGSLALACGGRVIDDGSREPGESPGSGGARPGAGQVSLPPCEPGFRRADEPTRPCAFIDPDGRCYATKLEACACVCAATGGDVCSSPLFDPPESAIPVDCF